MVSIRVSSFSKLSYCDELFVSWGRDFQSDFHPFCQVLGSSMNCLIRPGSEENVIQAHLTSIRYEKPLPSLPGNSLVIIFS